MPEPIDDELIQLACGNCGKFATVSYGSLANTPHPKCPYCGHLLPANPQKLRKEALRKAEELDTGPDALGSLE